MKFGSAAGARCPSCAECVRPDHNASLAGVVSRKVADVAAGAIHVIDGQASHAAQAAEPAPRASFLRRSLRQIGAPRRRLLSRLAAEHDWRGHEVGRRGTGDETGGVPEAVTASSLRPGAAERRIGSTDQARPASGAGDLTSSSRVSAPARRPSTRRRLRLSRRLLSRPLRPGCYRVRARATDATGNRGAMRSVRVKTSASPAESVRISRMIRVDDWPSGASSLEGASVRARRSRGSRLIRDRGRQAWLWEIPART